jgi:hypothetical protein
MQSNAERPPVGVYFVHQHYPGFIDVLPNALYLVDGGCLRGAVQVIRHVRPLVITDFDNRLVRAHGGAGEVFTRLQRSIPDISDDSNVVDAKGFEGRSAPTIAIEKDVGGRIFYQDVFTELQTLTEFVEPEPSTGLISHGLLVQRFVSTYRYLHPDPRLEMPPEIPIETTPLRVGHYLYSAEERSWPFERRIEAAWPSELHLSITALGRGVRSLRDHDVPPDVLEKRSRDLNAWLCNGFELSENLVEIERLVDVAFSGKRYRTAVIEAMSLLEVALLQARDRVPATQRSAPLRKSPNSITLEFLINTILPQLLRQFDGDPAPLIERANSARKMRNKVVHQRADPTSQEAGLVLSTVRAVLSILELPEQFKGDWKRRP